MCILPGFNNCCKSIYLCEFFFWLRFYVNCSPIAAAAAASEATGILGAAEEAGAATYAGEAADGEGATGPAQEQE